MPSNNPTAHAGIDLGQLFRKVARRSYVVVALMALGILLGRELTTHITPRYTSGTSILIDPKRPGSFGADSEFASLYVDSAKVASVLAILQSADLLRNVVESQRLADDPEFADFKPSIVRELLERFHLLRPGSPPSDTYEARSARAVAHLAHAIKVTRVGLTYVVDVEVTAATPAKAQRLAQALADSYLDDQTQSKAAATQRDYSWLTTRITAIRNDIRRSEATVEAIRQKFGLTETSSAPGSTIDQQAVTELNQQLLQAEADAAARRTRYEQAVRFRDRGGDLGALPEAVSSRVIEDLRKQQHEVLRRLADLSARYTPEYRGLIEAKRDEQALEHEIAVETNRLVSTLRTEYDAAEAKRQALASELTRRTTDEDSGQKAQGRVQLRDALQAVETNRELYQSFQAKLREVEQQLTRHDPEGRVISPATEPDSPSFPKPILFLGGGGLIGAMCGIGLSLLKPLPERGFANAIDAETRLTLSVLGILPRLKRSGENPQRAPFSVADYVITRPLSQFAECLRALRVSLQVGSVGGPHIVHLTSAMPGEGKSTIAGGLAISAALAGIRTALIDLDIRSSSVTDLFRLQNSDGVTNVLQGDMPSSNVCQKHRTLPLTIIPSGSAPSPRPDIISSQRLGEMVRDVARDHELVILDTPPVLAASDALFTAKLADATLLIVEAQNTPKPVVVQAVKALRAANAKLVGAVLNKAKPVRRGDYSSGYGAYGTYKQPTRKLTFRA